MAASRIARPMTSTLSATKSDLPPLRVHHLLYFLGVAAFAAATLRALRPIAPPTLGRELEEMAYWLGASLGASLWLLALCWRPGWRGFLLQPGPWLLLEAILETGFFSRLTVVVDLQSHLRRGPVAAALHEHWHGRPWSLMPLAVVGIALLGVAALPSRYTRSGPLWRALLALMGVQALACVFIGTATTELGRWQGWRLSTWQARSRGAAALAAAAVIHDHTLGRPRHWSHALATALWIAVLLGRNLSLGE
jgi:hypothetical protein